MCLKTRKLGYVLHARLVPRKSPNSTSEVDANTTLDKHYDNPSIRNDFPETVYCRYKGTVSILNPFGAIRPSLSGVSGT